MRLKYFILLSASLLMDIKCYSPNRQPRLTSSKDVSTFEQVIPARYKIQTDKSIYDTTLAENILSANFPEVEYPGNIADSTKPFYLSSSPFSNDVTSTFNNLAIGGTPNSNSFTKFKTRLNRKENDKSASILKSIKASKEAAEKQKAKASIQNKAVINPNVLSTKDTQRLSDKSENLTTNEDGIEYVMEFISELDQFMETITNIDTEYINLKDGQTIDSEHLKDFFTVPEEIFLSDEVTTLANQSTNVDVNKTNEALTTEMPQTEEDLPKSIFSFEEQDDVENIGFIFANFSVENTTSLAG